MGEMFLALFDWIFILAGKEDNHKSLHVFESQLDSTTDYPSVPEKSTYTLVSTLVPSFSVPLHKLCFCFDQIRTLVAMATSF